ncbi:MAG: FKBP-type peptidyl-prolyl cis-trans isomerase [Steroidobacteraceae bacterium]
MERRRRNSPTATGRAANGLAVAALLTGVALVGAGATPARAQSASPALAPAGPATTTTPAKKPGARAAAAAAQTPKSQGSYALGVSMGEQLRRAKVTPNSVSAERLAQGVRDALSGKVQMSQQYQQSIMALIRTAHESEAEPNRTAAAAFLAENAKKKDIVTTASGLQYKVINPGSGQPPKPTDQVSVNYRGALLNGTEFDSSAKHGGPATFPANQVIPGWQEALLLMKPGAKFQLFIPPKLAYDLDSPPSIPPGSMLIFDVELLSAKPAQAAAPQMHPQIPPPQPAQPQK